MICEKAYYPNLTGENRERLYCMDKRVKEFNSKCPFVYWCQITERFENTADAADCIYNGGNYDE